jgi:hypothetical protein
MAKAKKEDKELLKKQELYYQQWVDTYFNNSFNGRITSKMLKPHLSLESAEVDAARMLGNDSIQELIELKKAQIKIKEDIKLEWIVKELKDVVFEIKQQEPVEYDAEGRVINKKNYKDLLGAINQLIKISGYDNHQQKIDVTTNGENINQIVWKEEKTYTENEANKKADDSN